MIENTLNIDFSFCIITDNSVEACYRIAAMINSIRELQIPNYEILIIGGDINRFVGNTQDVVKISFDESIKPGWITKKKNEIAKVAKYDNLVIMHDYFIMHKNWYQGFLKNDIYDSFLNCDICCNPIFMIDSRRDYTDWVTWDHPKYGRQRSLNYTDWSCTKYQYISGGYFIIKKHFFLNNPFNENLVSHQAEDVDWSLKIRDKAKIICNYHSYVKHNKKHRNLSVDAYGRMI